MAPAVQCTLFPFHFPATAHISRCGNRIHRNDAVDAHFFEDIHRQRVGNAAIHVGFAVNDDGRANARDGDTRVNGRSNFTAGKYHAIQCVKMSGNNMNGTCEFGKMRVADRPLQAILDRATANETLARREDRIHQTPDSPASFDFAGEFFHGLAITPETPGRGDIRAHAASRDNVHLNPVLFQNLYDSYVREAFCAAG